MTTKKPLTEAERIDARLAQRQAAAIEDAGLSIGTLKEISEVVERLKADAALLSTLTGRVLMPEADTGFRPYRLWSQRATTVLDITKASAEQMLAKAEALTAPQTDTDA